VRSSPSGEKHRTYLLKYHFSCSFSGSTSSDTERNKRAQATFSLSSFYTNCRYSLFLNNMMFYIYLWEFRVLSFPLLLFNVCKNVFCLPWKAQMGFLHEIHHWCPQLLAALGPAGASQLPVGVDPWGQRPFSPLMGGSQWFSTTLGVSWT
jgi:hypothetical protein